MSHSPGAPTRLLVAVAHPDDETFGCGGLLLHAAAAGTVWNTGGCKSWYLDANGIPASWPWSFQRYQDEMAHPDLDDFELIS